jgi:hypothetical protein
MNNKPVVHLRQSVTLAICGAQLAEGETHPEEVNEETAWIVSCPKCREIAIAPRNIEHFAGNFLL